MNRLLTTPRLIGLGVALTVFALDQLVKWVMVEPLQLRRREAIEILPFFDLRWAQNFGISYGALEADSPEMRWGLVALTAAIALIVAIWMMREKLLGDILALAMILGGALGNIRDRYELGYVIDYADLHFGSFRPFLIFNIADAAISIGVVIILARSLFLREKETNPTSSPDGRPAES